MGEAKLNFEFFSQDFCFIGHSHQPFIVENNEGQIACPGGPEVEVKDSSRYLINVGSVGQPRDTDPRACYAICDLEEKTVKIKRIEYDVEAAQNSLIKQGLPKELAERLAYGW